MNVYIYNADIYCEQCGERIRAALTAEGTAPFNVYDETTYDSDDFPKGPESNVGTMADSPQHCASGCDCVNALTIGGPMGGTTVGAFLENALTVDGLNYVREAIAQGGDVAQFWAAHYAEDLA